MNMSNNEESPENEVIGKTSSPFREPNTTKVFYFWMRTGTRLNPFDFVVAEHFDGSRTIGIVDEIFAYTDSDSHLTDYIGSELGEPTAEPYIERVSAMVGRAQVLRNMKGKEGQEELYMPVPAERRIFFADETAIGQALGLDQFSGEQIPAGLIVQSNGVKIPVMVDSDYLIGPESAHANASGISGLATKTSYLMFLVYSMYQKMEESPSIIIFNVKGSDLLHIDEDPVDLTDKDREMYKKMDMKIEAFKNANYFLPRGREGQPDSDEPPARYQLYSYSLQDVYDELDLLFAEVPDPSFTLNAFIHQVRRDWAHGRIQFSGRYRQRDYLETASTWEELTNISDDTLGVAVYGYPTHPTPPRIKRELRRLTGYTAFVDARGSNELYLGEEIKKNIQPGKINVIDIYRVPTIDQPFVIGDVMRNIEELYHEKGVTELPHLIIFIDELNTFAPSGPQEPNPIARHIIEIASKGRYRRTALFGAQQFKSQVHNQVWENSALHAIGRTGSAELSTKPYREFDKTAQLSILNLQPGEMLISFRKWRNPIKLIFPKPPYHRLSSDRRD